MCLYIAFTSYWQICMVKFAKQRRNYRPVKRLRTISIETSQRLVQLLPKLCQVQTLSLDPRKLRANWQHPGDECYLPLPSPHPTPRSDSAYSGVSRIIIERRTNCTGQLVYSPPFSLWASVFAPATYFPCDPCAFRV